MQDKSHKPRFIPLHEWIARRPELTILQKCLICHILRYDPKESSKARGCLHSNKQLAELFGVRRATIIEALRDCISKGWVAALYETKYRRVLYVTAEKKGLGPLFGEEGSTETVPLKKGRKGGTETVPLLKGREGGTETVPLGARKPYTGARKPYHLAHGNRTQTKESLVKKKIDNKKTLFDSASELLTTDRAEPLHGPARIEEAKRQTRMLLAESKRRAKKGK